MIVLLLEDGLKEAGFEPLVAMNGPQALRQLAQESRSIRAVITDIRLGSEGPDGWKIARQARLDSPNVPVIYISGDSAGLQNANGVPGSMMLTKPFTVTQMITALGALLDQAPPPEL